MAPAYGPPSAPHFARRRLVTGDTLYNEGDAFHAIYAVRRGSMKSIKAMPGGRDQVIGFLIAGDVLALDGMATGRHAITVPRSAWPPFCSTCRAASANAASRRARSTCA